MELEQVDNTKNFEKLNKAIAQVLLLQRQTGLMSDPPVSESDTRFVLSLKTDKNVPVAAVTFDWNDNVKQWILIETTSQIEHSKFLEAMG